MHIKRCFSCHEILMKVFGLVFLFIIRLRFTISLSINDVIRRKCSDKALKNVRKFERLDYQIRKCQLDVEFLNTCLKYNVIANFLQFRVTNETLKDSLTYSRCQQSLLNEEIRCKKRLLHQLMFEDDRIKQELKYQLSPINFMHVSSLFLVSNDKAIRKNDKIHARKLQKLIPNIHEKSIIDNVSHNPNKIILFRSYKIVLFIILFQIIILQIRITRY